MWFRKHNLNQLVSKEERVGFLPLQVHKVHTLTAPWKIIRRTIIKWHTKHYPAYRDMSAARRRRKIKPINPEEQPYIHPFIADCVQEQSTAGKNNNKKKRRWSTGEKTTTNKRRNSIPDLLQLNDTAISEIKDCTEITERMTNIQVDAASTTSIMLEEIKRMKGRLSEKITANKTKDMADIEKRFNDNIKSTIDSFHQRSLRSHASIILYCSAEQSSHPVT